MRARKGGSAPEQAWNCPRALPYAAQRATGATVLPHPFPTFVSFLPLDAMTSLCRSAAAAALLLSCACLPCVSAAHKDAASAFSGFAASTATQEELAAGGPPAAAAAAPGEAPTPLVPSESGPAGIGEAVAFAPLEPYTRTAVPKTLLPQVYGIKTLLFGLTLLFTLCYLVVKEDNSFKIKPSVLASLNVKSGGGWDKEKSKEKLSRLMDVVKGPANPLVYGMIFAAVCIVSGITEVFKSLRRRRKAKQGLAVSYAPPLRAIGSMHVGIVLQLIAVFGLFFTSLPQMFGLIHVSAAMVVAAAALFLSSSFQRGRFRSGVKGANTTPADYE
ncbi:hypothetical protein Efla_001592 [Eimeria flavescens]